MSLPLYCDECDTNPVLCRKDNRTLAVKCACSDRSVKVADVLPSKWRRENK